MNKYKASNDNVAKGDASRIKLFQGCCLSTLKLLADQSIDCIITDPPYFIEGLGADWDKARIAVKASRAGTVGGLPTGMKFNPKQGRAFEAFMHEIAEEAFRVLKPGGFFICFSQARLVHRLGVAVEDAGFEVRDLLGWTYEGMPKAFSQDHFVEKMKITGAAKDAIIAALGGRKTPQLKPCIEPMILAQKPKEGTFVENWTRHGVGLIDTTVSLDGKFPGNLMAVAKPSKEEKGAANDHISVKPLRLMEHLIKVFTKEGDVILDPFAGSGTTGLAALNTGRNAILIEREPDYCDIIAKRCGIAIDGSEKVAA